MAFQYRLWAAQTVERCREWHANITFGQHAQSINVGRSMPALPLGSTRSKDVGHGMTSPPLNSAHGRTTSSATCHHRHKKAHTVKRRRAWHDIITFGQHKRSNDVGRGMPSCLWEAHTVERCRAWHDITALGRHALSKDIGCGMTSPPLDSIDNRQRRAWYDITARGQHTVGRRQAWHNITALGQHTRLDYVRHGMTSLPLYNTHG